MIRKVEEEKTALKQLEEQATQFNNLVSEVFVAVGGCSNADKLAKRLMTVYVSVYELKHELQKFI